MPMHPFHITKGIIMKQTVIHPTYGEIIYEEGLWSGKKTLFFHGVALNKVKKNVFRLNEGDTALEVTVAGSVLTGVVINVRGEEIRILPKPAWYDLILSILPFMLIMVWGNSVALCSIIPVIGGAIGGALGGAAMVLTLYMLRGKKLMTKLLTAILATAITFGVGAVLAYALVYTILM